MIKNEMFEMFCSDVQFYKYPLSHKIVRIFINLGQIVVSTGPVLFKKGRIIQFKYHLSFFRKLLNFFITREKSLI